MADEIKAGDTVQLKSGGPIMTVDSVEDGRAYCQWFDSKSEPHGDYYALVVLKKSELPGESGFQQKPNW